MALCSRPVAQKTGAEGVTSPPRSGVALGAGIGVDYGIYLFSRMQEFLHQGLSVRESYERTLPVTGASIIFTGITLAIGVATWAFSPEVPG